jgi:hypothetical protein
LVVLVAGCAKSPHPAPEPPLPIDAIWAASIQPGDLIVAVPGTGAHDNVGQPIDAAGDAVVDARADAQLNPIVLEQAIAAATRAGISTDDLTFALWGSGATRSHFTYRGLGGITVPFVVIGGQNACAVGALPQNILNYTRDNADADARDLLARIAKLGSSGQVTIVSHSWGGAVAEHVLLNDLEDASLTFVVAAGVPKAIVGERFVGPGLRPEGAASLYEVDRPDDPVHALDFAWDIEGHQYDIMWGDTFEGSYGITTSELSCHRQPGPCPN